MKQQTHKQRRTATEEPPLNGQKEIYWGGQGSGVGQGVVLNTFYSHEASQSTQGTPLFVQFDRILILFELEK